MKKYLRTILYISLISALLLNMFVFELANGYYYILNSFLFFLYTIAIFIIRKAENIQTQTEIKVFKVIIIISILSLLVQLGSVIFLKPYNYRDLSILVFSIANLLAFFVVVYMYEMRT